MSDKRRKGDVLIDLLRLRYGLTGSATEISEKLDELIGHDHKAASEGNCNCKVCDRSWRT